MHRTPYRACLGKTGSYNIGKRRKDHGTERQSPVVIEQHAHISEKCHTCIKDLRGKLSHTFHAVIHVGDRLRDDISGALFFQLHTGFMYQCPVQDPLHPPVYIVGEPAHIEPLDISRQLHRSDHDHIGGRQPEHRRKTLRPCQDLHQAARHLSLKPWPRHEAQVIDQSRHRDQRQNLPFCPEIHHDLIWAKIFLFHFCSFLKSYKLFRVTDFSLKQLLLECLFLFLLQFLQKYLFSAPDPEFLVLFIITAAFKILASNSSIFYIFFYSSAPSIFSSLCFSTNSAISTNPALRSFFDRQYSLSSVSQNAFFSSSGSSASSHS